MRRGLPFVAVFAVGAGLVAWPGLAVGVGPFPSPVDSGHERVPEGLPPTGTYEPHDPITISGPQDLLLPDPISGNGVRHGSGLPSDPYVIERWNFTIREAPAIAISGVDVYVVIRDVEILGSGNGAIDASGIAIWDSTNIFIESIVAKDLNNAILGVRSKFSLLDSAFYDVTEINSYGVPGGFSPFWGKTSVGLALMESDVRVQRVSIDGVGYGVYAKRGTYGFTQIVFTNVTESGIHIAGSESSPYELELHDASISSSPELSQKAFDKKVGQGVWLADYPSTVTLSNISVDGFSIGINSGSTFRRVTPPDATLAIMDCHLSNNAYGFSNRLPGLTLSMSGCVLSHNQYGFLALMDTDDVRTHMRIEGNVIAENWYGVYLYHRSGRLDEDDQGRGFEQATRHFDTKVRANDIVANQEYGLWYEAFRALEVGREGNDRPSTYPADYRLDGTNNYWGGTAPPVADEAGTIDAVSPYVDYEPYAVEPFTDYEVSKWPQPTQENVWIPAPSPVLVVLGILLAGFALARRRV